jgi:hypothetical protein
VIDAEISSFVAECFWPGVREADLRELDERAQAAAAAAGGIGEEVRYLGAILLREDEVVLCRFEGAAVAVRRTAEEACIPFERILETAQSPWPLLGAAE